MTQFNPPQPPDGGLDRSDPFEAEMTQSGPAPMSGLAIAGFVSSVIICCPVISPLLGLILSIIGLMQTKGGARRGRGLAIAGIIISLIVAPMHGFGGFAFVNLAKNYVRFQNTVIALQGSDLEAQTSALYELGSQDFQSEVSKDQLKNWAENRLSDLGGLQSIAPDRVMPYEPLDDGSALRYRWQAQFPEETVLITTDITFDFWHGSFALEDIAIGGESAIEAYASGQIESSPDKEPDGD